MIVDVILLEFHTMKLRPRFSLRTTLLGTAIVASLVSLFLPPRVFFHSKVVSINHLDNGKTTYSMKSEFRNAGLFPIWYRTHSFPPSEVIIMGATLNKNSGKRYVENAKWWTWTRLNPGDSIQLDEPIFEDEIPGLQVQDWTGRLFNLFDHLDIDELKSEFENAG